MDRQSLQGLCHPLVKRLDLMPPGSKKGGCSGEGARGVMGLEYVSPGEHHCASARCSLSLPPSVRNTDIRRAPPHPASLINSPTAPPPTKV